MVLYVLFCYHWKNPSLFLIYLNYKWKRKTEQKPFNMWGACATQNALLFLEPRITYHLKMLLAPYVIPEHSQVRYILKCKTARKTRSPVVSHKPERSKYWHHYFCQCTNSNGNGKQPGRKLCFRMAGGQREAQCMDFKKTKELIHCNGVGRGWLTMKFHSASHGNHCCENLDNLILFLKASF